MAATRWLRPAILASPLVFLLHDLEEYLAVGPWLETAGPGLPTLIRERVPELDVYVVAFGLLFVVQAVAALLAARRDAGPVATLAFALLVMGRLTNVVTHGAQAAVTGGYVPGLVSALLVVVPFAVLLLDGLIRDDRLRRGWLLPLFLAGFVVQGAAIVGALGLASVLT